MSDTMAMASDRRAVSCLAHGARQDALDRLLSKARAFAGATAARAFLFSFTGEIQDCVLEATAGDGAEGIRGLRVDGFDGIAMRTALLGNAVWIARPLLDPSYSVRCDGLPMVRDGLLCVPLRGRTIRGALSLSGCGSLGAQALVALIQLVRQAALEIERQSVAAQCQAGVAPC